MQLEELKRFARKAALTCLAGAAACLSVRCAQVTGRPGAAPSSRRVIVVVLDGLRPDSINPTDTPNLLRLRDDGTEFTDNHSTYPTFTMMNSASLATGGFPGSTGFYGNVLWQPGAQGKDSAGRPVDFRQPVFAEDYAILDGLNARLGGDLLLVGTLFDSAQKAGMQTFTFGKNGAAYLQDLKRGGMMLNERTVFPLGLARQLQAAGIALPDGTPGDYPSGELVLASNNGRPTEFRPPRRLRDGVSSDPTDASGSRFGPALEYMVNAYLEQVMPKVEPRLSVLWLRDPDGSEHEYGVGAPNHHGALRLADSLLGRVLGRLKQLGQEANTDLIVVSDHGHSNVSGPTSLFPLRAVSDGVVGDVDPRGHSVSGLVRLADLMRRRGFVAFDGLGCTYLPVAAGIKADGSPVYPTLTDRDGSICGKPGQRYQAPPLRVPAELPGEAIVVAVNGGSDYLYVPSHDPALIREVVRFLQRRSEVGAIFVDDRYPGVAGTLPLSAIKAKNPAGRNPDVIVSYDFDEMAVINGIRGTEYAGMMLGNNYRGMHGSFSPVDVHNTLIAAGPDFRERFKDALPTGNVDVAPTVARILGLPLPRSDGRPLLEALKGGPPATDYRVESAVLEPEAASGLTIHLPTDPEGKDVDAGRRSYTFQLRSKSLTYGGARYSYFDSAKAIRR